MRFIFSQVAIFFLGSAGHSEYMIGSNINVLSYVIRREERLALKDCSLTADEDRAWFEPSIREFCNRLYNL